MRNWLFTAAALLAPHAALAQAQPGPDPVETLTRCRSVADPAARLACFDSAAAAVETAREKKEIVVLDRAEVKKTRRSLFGFTLPRIKFLEGDGDDEAQELKELTGKAVSVAQVDRDHYVVTLDDGSRWQTIEPARFAPRTGASVRIKRAAMGSFMATFNEGRSIRVKRVS